MGFPLKKALRMASRTGFLNGIMFVLAEVAHGTAPRTRAAAERSRQRVEWVVNRLIASDEPFSLHDLDEELPRLDGTRINDQLPVKTEHAGAPPAEPGSGCRAGTPASRP